MFFSDVAYAMGSTGGAGGEPGGALGMNLLLMVVIFAIFYFLIIRPQSKEARRIKDMLANLKRGDRVITVGGLYGEVLEIKGEVALLNLGDATVEIGLKYIANLAPARSGISASGGKQKRRPAPRREQEKTASEQHGENETEVNEAEVNEAEVIDTEPEEEDSERKDNEPRP